MKKSLLKWIPACLAGTLLCACGGSKVADGDYAGAFRVYVNEQLKAGTWVLSADEDLQPGEVDSIEVEILGEVTVADSIRIGLQEAVDSYVSTVQRLKYEMNVAEHNYKLDENSQFARRADYERKLKEELRNGNDRKDYRQAIERLPKNHEEYEKFDKSRDFSYMRKYEEAREAFEECNRSDFEDEYISSYEGITRYTGRDTNEVLGDVALVEFFTPDGYQSTTVLFNRKPTYVKAIISDADAIDADGGDSDDVEYEAE